MKYFNLSKIILLFAAFSVGCFLIAFSSCNEFVEKAKQLIPEPGEQYNAAEEMRKSFKPNKNKKETKGQLIFLVHGLNDSVDCFEETVKSLKNDKEKYFELGYITMHNNSKNPVIHYAKNYSPSVKNAYNVNELINKGQNVLVRIEFSDGNLSFNEQFSQMGKMIEMFKGHNANVVFIGHSMGGLASINYGIDYAKLFKNKKIKIITVDTPYHPNQWARFAWDNENINRYGNINAEIVGVLINSIFYKKPVGEAHRDLGGCSTALEDLKNKWNANANNENLTLYAIAVSMYAKSDENDKKNTEKYWSDKGDGVVDIPSQQGKAWNNVNQQDIIFGYGRGHELPIGDVGDTTHLYHHANTPQLTEVVEQIKKIVMK